MYLPETYQVKAILFHKGDIGKSSHKKINWRSFLDLIYGDEYQKKLKDRKLLGLLTHSGRRDARNGIIPHADTVAISPYLCNVLTGVSDDEDCVYGYFDLIETESAERFKKMMNMGVNIGVSISTELIEANGEYIIQVLHGVDFTLYPEFDSPIIDRNFSEAGDQSFLMDYPVDSPNLVCGDFSVRDYIREATFPPYRTLKTKIDEVINYLKYTRDSTVYSNKRFLKQYVSSFVKKYLTDAISSDGPVNVIVGLRLDQFVDDRQALRDLNMAMTTAKNELKSGSKVLSSATQKKLNQSFNAVMSKIYEYEEKKSGKRKDISTEVSEKEEKKEFSMPNTVPLISEPGDLDLVKPSAPFEYVEGDKYRPIEDFILDNYTRPDFIEAYKAYLADVNFSIDEPLLGDSQLANISEGLRNGYQVEEQDLKNILDSQSFNFNYVPYDEVFALARDCREMNPSEYEGFKNAFDYINVKYPSMEELCTEMGPSLDEMVETLGEDFWKTMEFAREEDFPLAYYEFSKLYDDDWYMRLKPETISRLIAEATQKAPEPKDSSSVRDILNHPVTEAVLGTVTGSKPMNFLENTIEGAKNQINKYSGSSRHAGNMSQSKSFSEVADQIIAKQRMKEETGEIQNREPVKDSTSSTDKNGIPTGDKPKKHLAGNPNKKKDMSIDTTLKDSFRDTVDDIIYSYINTPNSRDPNRDMAANTSTVKKTIGEFTGGVNKGLKDIEKGVKGTTLGKSLMNAAELNAKSSERLAKLGERATRILTPIDSIKEAVKNKKDSAPKAKPKKKTIDDDIKTAGETTSSDTDN